MPAITMSITLDPRTKAFLDALRLLDGDTTTPPPAAPQPLTLTPPAHGEYWPGQGGHYICSLPTLLGMPARHLIAGPECPEQLTYGSQADVTGATSHIDGRANTAVLLATGQRHPAAHWADSCNVDGHTDFFLPAKLDLVMAHICAPGLFNKSGYYWTSTQYSRDDAFVQAFEDGDSDWYSKGIQHRVRAFRWIQAT